MKVSGNATLNAPVEKVWAALNDPAVLVRTIPGCERLEEIERDAYRMTVTAGVASIKGSYAGDVRLTDLQEPHAFVLKASGAGGPGTVSADVKVRLVDGGDGTTVLSYDAEAIVGGMIGGVGQRILTGVAKKTAAEFFKAVDDVLNGVAAPVAVPVAGAAETGVFTAPGAAAVPAPGEFVKGAVFGAGVALLGALVGGFVARRRG